MHTNRLKRGWRWLAAGLLALNFGCSDSQKNADNPQGLDAGDAETDTSGADVGERPDVADASAPDASTPSETGTDDCTNPCAQLVLDTGSMMVSPPILTSWPSNFIAFDNKVAFSATHPQQGTSIYLTDGTTAGTQVVADLDSNAHGGGHGYWRSPIALGDRIIYGATLGSLNAVVTPWLYDASEGRLPLPVTDALPAGEELRLPAGELFQNGQRVVFTGRRPGESETAVYAADGTSGSTEKLFGSGASHLVSTGDAVLFDDGDRVYFVGDGQPEAITPSGRPLKCAGAARWKGEVWFVTWGDGTTDHLWRSDGTQAGTREVTTLPTSTSSECPYTTTDTHLFFVNSGTQWSTDGTASGTVELSDESVYASRPLVGGLQAATASSAFYIGLPRDVLWRSEGTVASTTKIQTQWTEFANPMVLESYVYLSARAPDGEAYRLVRLDPADNSMTEVDGAYGNLVNSYAAGGKIWILGERGRIWVFDPEPS